MQDQADTAPTLLNTVPARMTASGGASTALRLYARVALAALSVSISACGGGGGGTSGVVPRATASPPPGGNRAIDMIVQSAYPNGWGVELAIYKNGQPRYVQGYGLRDRGEPDVFGGSNFWGLTQPDKLFHLPRGRFTPDVNTDFDLASVSKEFTAGAILLLQQDGKLTVNDPLSKYFPNLPSAGVIPLLYLLQHRSGFVDYNTFGVYPDFTAAYQRFMASGEKNYQPIVDRLATFPLNFAPGSRFQYSNTNYLLLGMIVAQISGEPLGDFLRQRIFGPLGMSHTQQGYPLPPMTDLALGYEDDGAGPVRSWQWNLQWLAGPGGLTSTVADIDRWDRAVRTPGIFSQVSLAQMFTPSPYHEPFGSYADGWFVSSLQGHRYIWHDGALGGFETMNATFPDDGIEIVILTNDGIGSNGSGLDPYYIIPKLFPVALAK